MFSTSTRQHPTKPVRSPASPSARVRPVLWSVAAMAAAFATSAAQAQSLALVTLPPLWLGSHSVSLLPLDEAVGMGGGVIIGRKNNVGMAVVDGQLVALRGKSGYTNVQPTAISRNGQIVGTGRSNGQVRGLYWQNHASDPIDMGALTPITVPRSVNSSGVAVGEMVQPLANGGNITTAFVWSAATGLRTIAPTGSSFSSAHAISDSGYAAGEAISGSDLAAMRWYPGLTQAGVAAYGQAAHHVKENGTIYNQFYSWGLLNQQTRIAPSTYDVVAGISEPGRVAGTTLPNPLMPTRRAWTLGFGTPLKNLPLPVGALETIATQVDDCGSVLGQAVFPSRTTQAVFWSISFCDTPPTTRR